MTFVLPSTIAPAAFSFATSAASAAGIDFCSAIEPPVVGRPFASIVSSSRTGRPCSGPRTVPAARSASSAFASATAPLFSERTACRAGPSALVIAIRVRYAFVSVSLVSVPEARRSRSAEADSVSSENGRIVFPPASASVDL